MENLDSLEKKYMELSTEQVDMIRRTAREIVEQCEMDSSGSRITYNKLFAGKVEDGAVNYRTVNRHLNRQRINYVVGRHLYQSLGCREDLEFLNDFGNYTIESRKGRVKLSQ